MDRSVDTAFGRLDRALSLVDDALVWTNAELRVEWCNAAFDRLVGRSHAEVVGAQLDRLLPLEKDGRPIASDDSPFVRADGDCSRGVYELGPRALEICARRTAWPEDTVVVSIRDVTERIQREAAHRELYAQLAATNRELEAFTYSASHDLRAPLRTIEGFTQALLEDYGERLPEKGRDYLRRVRGAAQRMTQLIDDLLRLSRVTRTELRRERVDVTALARSIGEELSRAAPDRRVQLVVREGLEADADARLLRILLENLLGNSWKFTAHTPEPRVEVSSKENGERIFVVRDNGAGFDMARAEKLFGPFQRLHDPAEFPGTGIGLATAQRIVHLHGGRIWAEGEPGRGATLSFTLGQRRRT